MSNENFLKYGSHHPRRRHLSMEILRIRVVLVAAVVSCLVLYHSAYPTLFFQSFYNPISTSGNEKSVMQGNMSSPSNNISNSSIPAKLSAPSNYETDATRANLSSPFRDSTPGDLSSSLGNDDKNDLERILNKAAMKDKTVIITTLNAAWTGPNSIFDLFLEGFRIGNQTQDLLNHVVFVALDQKAYSRCLGLHPHCYALGTTGIDFSGEAFFMSEDYLNMMWRRIEFLHIVLEMGYNFIFSDADIMWFRNPFPRFHSDGDFQIACDHYWYSHTDMDNLPNGGFNYVKANNRTRQFYKFWYESKDKFPGKHDQDVLNFIKYDPFIAEIGLQIRFLYTAYFGGFCEPSDDMNVVCTMHANCCIGIENKIHDLNMLIDDWKKYMALTDGERILKNPSWTVPRICGSEFILALGVLS